MCVYIFSKRRGGGGGAGDSTSNMNGLSAGPLMCLFISEHIRAGWSVEGLNCPRISVFLGVSDDCAIKTS